MFGRRIIILRTPHLSWITCALIKSTVIIVSLQACSSGQSSDKVGDRNLLKANSTVVFSLDSVASNSNQLYQRWEGNLYVMNEFFNSIDIYSLDSMQLVDRIMFDKNGSEGIPQIDGFYVFNQDSIIVFSERNADGVFLKGGKPSSRVSDYVHLVQRSLNHHIGSALPVMAYDGKLYLYNLPMGGEIDKVYQALDFVIDFENDTTYFIKSTKTLDELKAYPEQFRFPTRCLIPEKGEIVYAYQFSEELLVYDIESGAFEIKGLSAPSIGKPSFNGGFKSDTEIALNNDLYGAFVWDDDLDRLYRFVNHSTGGEGSDWLDQPVSIVISDSNFTFQKEMFLTPVSDFLTKDFWFSDEGLMISNANFNNESLDEDAMPFTLVN